MSREDTIARAPTNECTAFEIIETKILDAGGRGIGGAGKLSKSGNGFEAHYYLSKTGRPIILQKIRGGAVEVYVPVSSSNRIDVTMQALAQYAHGDEVAGPVLDAARAVRVEVAKLGYGAICVPGADGLLGAVGRLVRALDAAGPPAVAPAL